MVHPWKVPAAIAAFFGVSFLLLPTVAGAAGEERPPIDQLVHQIDQLYRSESSQSEVEMQIHTSHWERTLTMDVWTDGTEKTFIRIESPAKEEGTGTLRIGNEMWNYLPKTNKVIRIPPSMMMGSWMGSDFTNDDLVKEFTFLDDYDFAYVSPEGEPDTLFYIDCVPHPDLAVVWGNVVIAVRKDSHLPVWQKYYDERGELSRVLLFSDVRKLGGRTVPSVMKMMPQNKEESWTLVRYREAEFDASVDDDVFSLRNLRSAD